MDTNQHRDAIDRMEVVAITIEVVGNVLAEKLNMVIEQMTIANQLRAMELIRLGVEFEDVRSAVVGQTVI